MDAVLATSLAVPVRCSGREHEVDVMDAQILLALSHLTLACWIGLGSFKRASSSYSVRGSLFLGFLEVRQHSLTSRTYQIVLSLDFYPSNNNQTYP